MQACRSFCASRVFPWLNDIFLAGPALERIRAEALGGGPRPRGRAAPPSPR